MEEEQKSWRVGKIGRIKGMGQSGKPYDFYGGFVRAIQLKDRVIEMVKDKNPEVEVDKVNGKNRHKVPITIISIPEKYIDYDARHPKTHTINVGEVEFNSMDEPEDHDFKLSDINKMKI